jgi:small subunit ribosomal protein S21
MKNYNNNKLIKGLSVEVKDGNINVALRKLKKKMDETGKLIDYVDRQFYEKPTAERKRKKDAAKARWRKHLREQQLPKKNY